MGRKKKGAGGSCHQQQPIKNHPEHEEEDDEAAAVEKEEEYVNDNSSNNKKTGGGGGDRGRSSVVLRVPIHCDGCSDDVRRSLKGFPGIEKVDMASNKLTVVGEVDPIRIRERVEQKTGKKVDIISPVNPKKKPDPKQQEDKKPKEPPFSTVVLRIALHCEGCIHRIYKTIRRFEGVAHVSMDIDNDLVIVKGIMEVKKLIEVVKEKMKRPVQIVPPRKESGGAEVKDKCSGKEGQEKVAAPEKCQLDSCDGRYCAYTIQMVHAPQLFSDENPNACSIM